MSSGANELRRTRYLRALQRVPLLMGADRELTIGSAVTAVGLAVTSMNLVATVIGLLIWCICFYGLRRAGKADPLMKLVYWRQLKYQRYYPARTRASRLES